MSIPLTINGVTYNYPKLGDENWGQDATNWAVGITQLTNTIQTILNNTVLSGIFELSNGSAVTPSLRFQNSLSTGLYRVGADILGFSAAGVAAGQISSGGLLQWKDGSAAAPAFSFNTDGDIGMYRIGANQLGFATNGALALNIDAVQNVNVSNNLIASGNITATDITSTALLTALDLTSTGNTILGSDSADNITINAEFISNLVPDATSSYDFGSTSKRWRDVFVSRDAYINRGLFGNGTVSLPSISFESDLDTGIYRVSSNTLGFATGATLMGQIASNGVWTIGASGGLETHVINGFGLQLVNSASTPITLGFLRTITISDNQSSPTLVFQFASTGSNAIVLDYSLVRGSTREVGTMHIVHNGTTADVDVENIPLGDCGVLFSADISGGFVRLLYTSTNTGTAGTFKFTSARWDH